MVFIPQTKCSEPHEGAKQKHENKLLIYKHTLNKNTNLYSDNSTPQIIYALAVPKIITQYLVSMIIPQHLRMVNHQVD